MTTLSPTHSPKKSAGPAKSTKGAKDPVQRKPAYLRCKMAVSQPQDPEEREADQVAQQVSRSAAGPAPAIGNQEENIATKPVPAAQHIQRRTTSAARDVASEEEQVSPRLMRQALPEEQPLQTKVQRQAASPEQEQPLQTKLWREAVGPEPTEGSAPPAEETAPAEEAEPQAGGSLENQIDSSRGRGETLPDSVREDMESQFGQDFSQVNIHTGSEASRMCAHLNARAFAIGNDIYFAAGEFAPETGRGRELLAHELTHVVQQSGQQTQRKAMRTGTGTGTSTGSTPTSSTYSVSSGNYQNTEINPSARTISITRLSLPSFKRRNRSLFPSPLTIRRGRRPNTNQIPNWRTAVNQQATSQLSSLAQQARNRGGVNESGQVFLQAREQPDFLLFGTEEQLLPRFEIPMWDKSKQGRTFQVDHIREMQLGGDDLEGNYELLDATANMSAGWRLGNPQNGGEIGTRIRAALRALRAANPSATNIPASTDWETVRYGYAVTFLNYDFNLNVNGDGDQFWSLDDVRQGRHSRLLRPLRENELSRLGQEGRMIFFTSEQGGNRLPLARRTPMRNWLPRVDLLDWQPNENANTPGDIAGILVVDAFKSASGRARDTGVSVDPDYPAQNWQVKLIDGVHGGYIDRESVAVGARQSLRLPGMSPIELDTVELTAQGIRGDGRVLPTVPLIQDADIRIRINGDNVELYKTFTGPEIQVPSPFEIKDTELTVFFSSGRGLGIEGRVDFGIDKVGEGFLGAAASTQGGFALEGEFNFDERLFGRGTTAQVRMGYADDQWSMGGTISIPAGKVPGIESATIEVNYSESDGFSAEGNAALNVPGVESGSLYIRNNEEDGFVIGGSFDLSSSTPGIRSGSISAEVREKPDGDGYALSATGTAVPDIPGVNSQLTVSYNDGAFTAEFSGDYRRGMLSGRITAGVTNRTLNEDGTLADTAEPDNPLLVYGGGNVTIRIAPWLQGTAGIVFDPNGEVTVSGEIGIPNDVEIFARREVNRSLFNIAIQAPIVPGIVAEVGGGLSAVAGIGPGVIDQLRLGITYNPAREEDTRVTGDAHLRVPADAGLRLSVRAGIGLGITGASATGGLEIGGTLGIEGAAEAGVHIDWTPSQGLDLSANLSVYAQPSFTFDISGYVSVRALGFSVYDERWQLASYTFGSGYRFGIRLPVRYREGQPFNISLSDVQFDVPNISPRDILRGLIRRIA